MLDYILIGQRIKRSRREKNITQEKMAEALRVSVGYISQLERGITRVNLEMLARISELTDKELSYFICGINSEERDYAVDETARLLNKLSSSERKVFLRLLKSYIDMKDNGEV